MFKYSYNNKMGQVQGSCSNQHGINHSLVAMDSFSESDLIRKVTQVTEDEFGIYETTLLHAINGRTLEVLTMNFTPHKAIMKDQAN